MHYQTKQSKRHIKFYEHTHLFLFSYIWPINLQASKTTDISQNTYFFCITLHFINYGVEILFELFDPLFIIKLEGVILMLKFFHHLGRDGAEIVHSYGLWGRLLKSNIGYYSLSYVWAGAERLPMRFRNCLCIQKFQCALSVHLAACLDVALRTEGYIDCSRLWKHHSLIAGLRALNKDTSSDVVIWAQERGLKSKAPWETNGSWYFCLSLHWSSPHLGEYYFTWTNCSLNSSYCMHII